MRHALRYLLLVAALLLLPASPHARNAATDEVLDLYCLRLAYPQIKEIRRGVNGPELWLEDGKVIPYASLGEFNDQSRLHVDLRASMRQPYPLEPQRPVPGPGQAPGRLRPYNFFEAIYGNSSKSVQEKLEHVPYMGTRLQLGKYAAQAFAKSLPELDRLARKKELAKYLKPEGAWYWRKIAGENVLSAHAYGIALDVGVKHSPYWRWSKKMPHPAQFDWPGQIVSIMEKHGFIWGGKWHEYDLMHFEYRPEIICKARMRQLYEQGHKGSFPRFERLAKGGKKESPR